MRSLFLAFLSTFVFLVTWNTINAQEHSDHAEESFPMHIVALDIGHAHLFEENEEGQTSLLSLPSYGINYTLQFNEHWGIGIHTDFIFEEYKVRTEAQGEDHEIIERVYPIAPALLGIYKLNERWSVLAGFGREFSAGENFWLNRAGVEYGVHLPAGWEVFGTLQYDVKWDAYDNWVLALGLAKHL
ncbi:MAG: hypothetical protein KDC53_11195 [Saprospiraceae bacterium]|nr:hypothetical protein [Saprospiraceae bacterium]